MLCREHVPPIEPAHTTWNDVTAHRALLAGAANAQRAVDESFEYDSEDDSGLLGGTPAGSPLPRPLRRAVWERPSGASGVLPSYQRSPLAGASGGDPFLASTSGADPPISSHLVLPTAHPKANYKHLYLVRRILSRRMTDTRPADLEAASRRTPSLWEPDVQILTSGSSTALGGLPGHAESIYSLHLFRRFMRVPLSSAGDLVPGLSAAWPSPRMSTSWPGPSSPAPAQVVSGRDWLLSGSRDCTLRLWALGTRPRVVKIFSGGHTRSILTHFVTELPGPDGEVRLMAISAGSDGRIVSWDLEGDGSPETVVQAHSDSIFFMRGNARHLVSCSKDRSIKLFSLADLSCVLTIGPDAEGAHRGAINAVSLTDELIVSASGDKSIKAWDMRTGRLVASCEAHSRGISSIGFEPAGSGSALAAGWTQTIPGSTLLGTLITGSSDSTIKTFFLVEVPRAYDEQAAYADMVADPAGWGGGAGASHAVHLSGGAGASVGGELGEGEGEGERGREGGGGVSGSGERDGDGDGGAEREAFVPSGEDGRRVVFEAGVEYWARCACALPMAPANAHGCLRCNNRGHTDLVRALHVGEDVALSASYDSTTKIWDRTSGRLIFDFEGCHSGRVFAITGDRMRVVSSGLDARIAIIDFSVGLDTAFV